ncbi:phosphatidylserine/phosphatidylglycerophosphate/cardiolipin synthase family protein [Kineococcus gynurae]|uniref:Phosphatidylserine/phosphatidylglycerophosphate/ cardiolipin synthase family protein n=1 Tax=Kineococcus gynurae TaxID=452979 RepID=A0ABV5LPB0_9ACTN
MLSELLVVADFLIKVVALGTVPEDRRPGSSSAWLLLIFFIPLVGLPLFLLLGSPSVRGRRHRVQQQVNAVIAERLVDVPLLPEGQVADTHLRSVLGLNRRLTSFPCAAGENRGLVAQDELVAELVAQVRAADSWVHVEFYIAALDATTEPFFAALGDAVRRGVRVRFLFDHLGARGYPGYHRMLRRLDADGVQWRRMMPIDPLRRRWRRPDLRNHRKLVVVDGRVAVLGSQNLIDPGYLRARNTRRGRRWVDLNVVLTGPVVQAVDAVFATDWFIETGESVVGIDVALPALEAPGRPGAGLRDDRDGTPSGGLYQVVPSGPGFPTEPNLRLFTALIHDATSTVSIVSPYFVPDEALEHAITSAVYRGVAVELFVSERADQFMVHHAQRSYYGALLRAGVRIHRLPAPAVLHSKFLVVDSRIAVFGSSNMDMRSFQLNYEVSLLGLEPSFVTALEERAAGYRSASLELTVGEWARRSLLERYLDNAMRLTAAVP